VLLISEHVHLALELNEFILQHAVFHLEMLHLLLKVSACLLVLGLPLLADFLLLDHHLVGLLFVLPVLLLVLEQLVLKLSNLDVTFIVKFIDSVVVDNFQSVQLTDGCVLLVSDGVDQLSQAFVLREVPFVISGVPVKLDLEFVHFNLAVLTFDSHGFSFLSLFLTLSDQSSVVFFVLELSLVELLAVLLILLSCLFLEVAPLVKHFVELLLQGVSFNLLLLLEVKGIRQLNLELSYLIILRVKDCSLLLPQCINQSVMPRFSVLSLRSDGVLKSFNLSEVLSLLELDSVSFEIGFFNSSLALCS